MKNSFPLIKLDELTKINMSKNLYKPDMTTKTRFKERDYMDALSYIGVLPE